MKNKGFSLLELLVVIGIISILLAIAVSSYSTTQKKTRDARRASDLKTIQQAAEQYYSVCGYVYPTMTTEADFAIFCPDAPTIMLLPSDKLPLDPKTGSAYTCGGTCDDTGFTLCATPELAGTICVTNQQ
ncbi:hypothetical protein A2313_03650 [Candidatus Roizmanbacteria bacterium RIFOXYB2_FULL_41_10]|uniref:Type II secretion system protein GspG C-terminal domain-containing protein n=1 Tax=Candidatus Roizmanbacteria bacterium RIFOXYA1_FULL_41_12 TaxID=1802082 RepID=A0A1F7KEM1_9BACT|nr:MAG: hypothetical protein A2209_02020 [Candidatus Roizmanbacteria bacterium RIFOXYA1_FULL_41_12]OGK67114.1 MAG: hypothetical protein A2377_00405 [Candidatus Roizmanbacteria bacterium RIFOXYB1_FULL_41_27]OGK68481.1 MAG: hypothetical protein A2262_03395 [Candidatus Roizmanbacteria bacterium RIFOXYA2_FULL_41_8]OGK69025.1 MAG: hypothetical protein A2313_03650 [Candidatus Roizmanbacteria bacterium RIFOXYB2_FULL_41_10]OGK71518.1 MAG: hypothetical protein A2403_00745 [Candidatus Roizmanbacteria bac